MKRNVFQSAFPAGLVVIMVTFLSTIFLVNAGDSFAATGDKKASTVVRKSFAEQTELRIKNLQSALKITDDQQELWKNMTQVMRENAMEMDTLSKDRAEISKAMNSVERMKYHSQISEAHLAQQKKLIPVFEALYTSMSDEQKKITDTIFRTGKRGKQRI